MYPHQQRIVHYYYFRRKNWAKSIWAFVVILHRAHSHGFFICWHLSLLVASLLFIWCPSNNCDVVVWERFYPYSPCASSAFPHTHACGSQACNQACVPLATLITSSDNLSLTAVIRPTSPPGGSATYCNQHVWLSVCLFVCLFVSWKWHSVLQTIRLVG